MEDAILETIKVLFAMATGAISGLYIIVESLKAWGFQKRRNGSSPDSETARLVKELYAMHNSRDKNGVYRWWVPSNWGEMLDDELKFAEKNASSLQRMAKLQEKLLEKTQEMTFEIKEMRKELSGHN